MSLSFQRVLTKTEAHRLSRLAAPVLLVLGMSAAMLWGLSGCTILDSRGSVGLPDRAVVLTFDDGPSNDRAVTRELLDVLQRHQVRAVFCVIGTQVRKHPDMVRRMHEEGHLLVNHSFNHNFGILELPSEIVASMEATDQALARSLNEPGFRTNYYRPPYGWLAPQEKIAMRRYGFDAYFPLTTFKLDTFTGPAEAGLLVEDLLNAARKNRGGIFVLHEYRFRDGSNDPEKMEAPDSGANRDWVPKAVDQIITTLKSEGYTFPDPGSLF